jgi:hypothetical protein
MELHQIRKLLHSKGNNYQKQKKPTEWKIIFANYSLDKGLISRIHKQLQKLNTKRISNPIIKWEK